jgi:hypothetical protein
MEKHQDQARAGVLKEYNEAKSRDFKEKVEKSKSIVVN